MTTRRSNRKVIVFVSRCCTPRRNAVEVHRSDSLRSVQHRPYGHVHVRRPSGYVVLSIGEERRERVHRLGQPRRFPAVVVVLDSHADPRRFRDDELNDDMVLVSARWSIVLYGLADEVDFLASSAPKSGGRVPGKREAVPLHVHRRPPDYLCKLLLAPFSLGGWEVKRGNFDARHNLPAVQPVLDLGAHIVDGDEQVDRSVFQFRLCDSPGVFFRLLAHVSPRQNKLAVVPDNGSDLRVQHHGIVPALHLLP